MSTQAHRHPIARSNFAGKVSLLELVATAARKQKRLAKADMRAARKSLKAAKKVAKLTRKAAKAAAKRVRRG